MFDTPQIMRIAQEMARHAGARQAQIAQNIANADTPNYRARDLVQFAEVMRGVSSSSELKSTRAGHIGKPERKEIWQSKDVGGQADPNGNTVSIEAEMVRSAQAKSSHDLALTVYKSSLDLLRASIGRGR